MGRPKQLLRRGGLTLLDIAVEAVEGLVDRVVISGDGRIDSRLDAYLRLPDPSEVPGPLGGILAAMRWDPKAAWVVVACDMPLVRPQAVEWLISRRRSDVSAVLPRISTAGVEPFLAVYEPVMRTVLERRAAEGRFGFQDLAGAEGVSCPQPPDEIRECWTNVNTLEDFRTAAVLDV